jgi:hypothetical protein
MISEPDFGSSLSLLSNWYLRKPLGTMAVCLVQRFTQRACLRSPRCSSFSSEFLSPCILIITCDIFTDIAYDINYDIKALLLIIVSLLLAARLILVILG